MLRGLKFYGFFTIISIKPKNACGLACTEEKQEGTFLKRETVIVLDFGGQYNQLIARRVRECNVYCEIYSYKTDIEKIKEIQPKGIIFTGGPNSAYLPDSRPIQKKFSNLEFQSSASATDHN